MTAFKLSEIPCEIKPDYKINIPAELLEKVLKKIDFIDRNKFNIYLSGDSIWATQMVPSKDDGHSISLANFRYMPLNMTEENLAKEIFILIGQLILHEYAETFRLNGKLMYDPHIGNRNNMCFKAVEELTKDHEQIKNEYKFITLSSIPNDTPIPEKKDERTQKRKTLDYFSSFNKKQSKFDKMQI